MTFEQRHLKYKFFGFLYYPLQFLIVRLCVFGFSLQLTLIEIYNGLNISSIVNVVLDFVLHLNAVVDVDYYLFIIFNIMPYLLRFVFECRNIIFFIFAFVQLVKFVNYQIAISTYKIDINKVVTIKIGQPGSGKSSSAGYESVLTAAKMWSDLQFKYWEYKSLISKWIKEKNRDKIAEWREIKTSYEYYITTDCVPCLWSNIPLQVNGQYSSILTFENAAQERRIPYYSVLYFDEVGSIFTVAMSKEKPLSVSDFFRLCRHYGDFRIFATEQDSENIFIDVRRVVAQNIYMLSQTWTNKPLILNLIYYLFKRFSLKYENGNRRLAQFLRFLRLVISYIGARKYKYVIQQNTELEQINVRQRIKTSYLPTNLNYQYSDRTFKNLYLCKSKAIKTDIFDCLTLKQTKENMRKFLKSAK